MYSFVFMLKTYSQDQDYVSRLVETYCKYNKDNIRLFIVAPQEDMALFKEKYASIEHIEVLSENNLDVEYAHESINGMKAGYINQEIVKLAFWELGLCKNYLCLDSEAYFIRDFYLDDFMYDEEIPYTALIEDNDLKTNPNYYHCYWKEREKKIQIIQDEMEYHPKHLLTCHGFQIFNANVLKRLKTDYMSLNNLSYLDLIMLSPYEFSWYNIWLQKSQVMPIHMCEPFFKTYHMAYQQFGDVMSNVDETELSRGYVGVVINSNYTKRKIIKVNDIAKLHYRIVNNKMLNEIRQIVNISYKKEFRRRVVSTLYSMVTRKNSKY